MTTKKAYEAKNTHEAWNEATGTARENNRPNAEFAKAIEDMYEFLEGIDPYTEYDEQDLGNNIYSLRDAGNDELADRLERIAAETYGTEEVEVRDWNDWGEDW